VVDASVLQRRIIIHALREVGCHEAADAEQALELIEGSIDLLVTEWALPGESGLDLVRALRADPCHATLKVVMMSARDAREDVARALEAGVDAYLIKPLQFDTLQLKLAQMARARGSEGTAPVTAD
jgi:two-component system chemotaxis response regulator CheY